VHDFLAALDSVPEANVAVYKYSLKKMEDIINDLKSAKPEVPFKQTDMSIGWNFYLKKFKTHFSASYFDFKKNQKGFNISVEKGPIYIKYQRAKIKYVEKNDVIEKKLFFGFKYDLPLFIK